LRNLEPTTYAASLIDAKLLPQQLQHGLRQGVCLGEHRVAGLHQDLQLREVHHFLGHVEVADAAFGSGQVL